MKKQNAITLIALIITIILMLILAGVVISLTIGENGLISTAKYTLVKNSEETAREKLELALADLQAHKYIDDTYNEKEYINSYLENEEMEVVEDVATVNGWRFKIDRSVPQIGESLGQEEIKVTKIVREYLGKNENGKYIAQITVIIESSKEIKSVIFEEANGTKLEVAPTEEKTKIAKDMIIELDKEYKIIVNKTDGKSEEKIIIEKLPELGILISTPYVGTSSFTTKVQYVTNEEEVESYTYMLDEDEIITSANAEYKIENQLEPETTYNVKVIAKYKNGLTVESNVVTIKTEKRTYLYNNGNECTEITDTFRIDKFNKGNLTFVNPIKDSNSINLNLVNSATYRYTAINTKDLIDLSNYQTIKFDYEITNTCYWVEFGISKNLNLTDVLKKYDTNGKRIINKTVSVQPLKNVCSINISDINDNCYIYCFSSVGVASDARGIIKINSIWLEK